jgi:hypothetical protein
MGFMKKQVEHGRWYVVETTAGTEYVPADLIGDVWDGIDVPDGQEVSDDDVHDMVVSARPELTTEQAHEEGRRVWKGAVAALREYCEGRIQSVESVTGRGARMSAPGYMDCTEWAVFDSEEEANAHLDDMYGEDGDDSDDAGDME